MLFFADTKVLPWGPFDPFVEKDRIETIPSAAGKEIVITTIIFSVLFAVLFLQYDVNISCISH